MGVPVGAAIAAAALAIGVPVIVAGTHLEARHRVAGAADAAALAAADAVTGWVDAEPCALAEEVTTAVRVELASCAVDARRAEARVETRASTPLGAATARARAGSPVTAGEAVGEVGANGWAWPSNSRGITQGFHLGYSIDLAVTGNGALYAPYDGVVVRAGPDGGGVPDVCLANPSWWRGPNHTVMIRHEYEGRVLFSSHNHIAPGSAQSLGVTVGSRVRSGQPVANAGMSGCTSGPHTHFTLATTPTNAFSDVNPFDYIGQP